jgi:tetratricopeptide (TPR) repeat protein
MILIWIYAIILKEASGLGREFIMRFRLFMTMISVFFILSFYILPVRAESVDEWISMGRDLCVSDNYTEGIDCYDKAISEAPDYFYTWIYKGYALDIMGNSSEANNCYNKAFSINPVEAYMWYLKLGEQYKKGKDLFGLGKNKEASLFFDSIFLMGPLEAYSNYRKAQQLYTRALEFFNTGKYEEAIEELDEAIKLEPANEFLIEFRNRCQDGLEALQ